MEYLNSIVEELNRRALSFEDPIVGGYDPLGKIPLIHRLVTNGVEVIYREWFSKGIDKDVLAKGDVGSHVMRSQEELIINQGDTNLYRTKRWGENFNPYSFRWDADKGEVDIEEFTGKEPLDELIESTKHAFNTYLGTIE